MLSRSESFSSRCPSFLATEARSICKRRAALWTRRSYRAERSRSRRQADDYRRAGGADDHSHAGNPPRGRRTGLRARWRSGRSQVTWPSVASATRSTTLFAALMPGRARSSPSFINAIDRRSREFLDLIEARVSGASTCTSSWIPTAPTNGADPELVRQTPTLSRALHANVRLVAPLAASPSRWARSASSGFSSSRRAR
jgi:hypothetical protein